MKGFPYVDSQPTFELVFHDEEGNIVDISGASMLEIHFQKPDGSEVQKTLTLSTDGTDGKARYKAEANFLDQAGTWEYIGKAVISGDTFFGGDKQGNPLKVPVKDL